MKKSLIFLSLIFCLSISLVQATQTDAQAPIAEQPKLQSTLAQYFSVKTMSNGTSAISLLAGIGFICRASQLNDISPKDAFKRLKIGLGSFSVAIFACIIKKMLSSKENPSQTSKISHGICHS